MPNLAQYTKILKNFTRIEKWAGFGSVFQRRILHQTPSIVSQRPTEIQQRQRFLTSTSFWFVSSLFLTHNLDSLRENPFLNTIFFSLNIAFTAECFVTVCWSDSDRIPVFSEQFPRIREFLELRSTKTLYDAYLGYFWNAWNTLQENQHKIRAKV